MKKIYVVSLFIITIIIASAIYIKISKGSYIILGTSPTFMPFEYIGGKDGDEIVGFDIEIAKLIAKEQNKKLKIEVMNFEELIPSLQADIIDMAICTMSITESRMEKIDFSTSYYTDSQAIVVRADDKSFDDIIANNTKEDGTLDNAMVKEEIGQTKKLSARTGTTGSTAAKEMAKNNYILEMPSCKSIILELLKEKVDVVVVDDSVARAFMAEHDNLRILPIEFEPEYYGVAVKKENSKLLNDINHTIDNLLASSQYNMLVENYINTRIEKGSIDD